MIRNFVLVLIVSTLSSIAASAAPLVAGSVTADGVVAQVTGGPANATDWVSLNKISDNSIVTWRYLNGQQKPPNKGLVSASVTVPLPPEGAYMLYLFANNGSKLLASSATFAVGAASAKPSAGVSSVKCLGALNCSGNTGDVTLTGTQATGPQGPPGPAGAGAEGPPGPPGPPGSMALGAPQKGVLCDNKHNNGQPGDSLFDYDSRVAPTQRFTWTCGSDGKWYQDAAVKVIPW